MSIDKKNKDGHIRLILLDAIGHASIRDDYDEAALFEVLGPSATFQAA
jgi:3-dehydroquinate synthetase